MLIVLQGVIYKVAERDVDDAAPLGDYVGLFRGS